MSESLDRELESLATANEPQIRAARVKLAVPRVVSRALAFAPLVPVVLVVYEIARISSGDPVSGWSFFALVGFASVLPLIVFALELYRVRRADVARRDALGEIDRCAELEDRLVNADEFLQRSDRDGFMQAAIEDAAAQLERARAARLRLHAEPAAVVWPWSRIAAAFALIGLTLYLGQLGSPGRSAGPDASDPRRVEIASRANESVDPAGNPIAARPPESIDRRASSREESEPSSGESDVGDDVKETRGSLGAGRPADASSSQGSSNSKAAPSNQGQSSKQQPDKKPLEKKLTPKKPGADTDPPKKKNASEESGSTAGRGSSRGSNKNPATSEWASKDQVTNPEDEAVEDDDEIEDEDEEQESRGGIQPNLRDRKPPVNRDLRIGFGNRKSPDANGRGGPSEQKKSRGVASLVLGVPVPDRIKGQPNRGKTKITQERIEPKDEDASAISSEARAARELPQGRVPRYDLKASLRRMIRTYFLTPRDIEP